ncbi:hypothetical protein V5O48_016248 [Marasmius crinis-equi]|uniref:Uncharacterized protein n=1 Tax=Marasmius crinis-equi TaxID=585013 RepID=A0ABR3ES91_9AGAR
MLDKKRKRTDDAEAARPTTLTISREADEQDDMEQLLRTLKSERNELETEANALKETNERLEIEERSLQKTVSELEQRVIELDEEHERLLALSSVTNRSDKMKHDLVQKRLREAMDRIHYLENQVNEGNVEVAEFVLESSTGANTPTLPLTPFSDSLETDELEENVMLPPSPSMSSQAQSAVPHLESEEGADWTGEILLPSGSSPMLSDYKPVDEDTDNTGAGEFGTNIEDRHDQVDEAPADNPVSFPADEPVPQWFQSGFNYVNVVMEWDYSELVRLWIVIEGLKGWRTPLKGLTARFRPQEVSNFMSKGRMRWEYGPQIGGSFVCDFSSRVQEWWNFLLKTSGSEWRSLNKCGINGWCLLLICMKWWALGMMEMEDGAEKRGQEKAWLSTLRDMNKAAGELVDYLESRDGVVMV